MEPDTMVRFDDWIHLIAEHASDVIYTLGVDEHGVARYLEWNPACERLSGVSAASVRGRTPTEAFGDRAGAAFDRRHHECIERGVTLQYESVYSRDGAKEKGVVHLIPVRDGERGDRIVRLLGIGINTGATERTAAALEASERRYRELLERLQEGVWAIDATGHTTYANPSMARILGYDVAEMQGRHLFSFMDEEAKAISQRNIERRAAGISEQHDFVFITRDGRRVETLMETSPLTDEEGRYTGAIAGVLDITALRAAEREKAQLERKLLETQRLESLGLLAGGIAHDLNNVLTAILGNASLGRASSSPSEMETAFEGIEEAARRAAEMCRQLLAYSGKGRFVVGAIDLSELVRDTTQLVRLSIRKDATVRFDLPPGLPPVSADVAQLRQVVMNLVINASEALSDTGGVISVRTGTIDASDERLRGAKLLSGDPVGEHVFLEVVDDGCGMTKEELERAFDPFYSTKFTGRGLGLSAVLGIVRGHKGALRIDSEPGRGTTFSIFLPRIRGAVDVQPPPARDEASWRGSGLVLVVDDEDAVRQATRRLLAHFGFEVITAADGAEGVAEFQRHAARLRCVLLDLTMPVLGGEAALAAMRRIRPDVPVILMSGFSDEEVSARFEGRDLTGFVQKPFDLRSLRALVRRAVEGGAGRSR